MKIIKTGEDKTPRSTARMSSRKKLIIVLAIIIGLIVIAAVGYRLMPQSKEQNDNKEDASIEHAQPVALRTSSDLQGDIDTTDDAAKKAGLYMALAANEQREGNFEAALNASMKSIEIYPTHEAYASAGSLYKAQGNTTAALEMYNKALTLTESSDNPDDNTPYNTYKMRIRELEGAV